MLAEIGELTANPCNRRKHDLVKDRDESPHAKGNATLLPREMAKVAWSWGNLRRDAVYIEPMFFQEIYKSCQTSS